MRDRSFFDDREPGIETLKRPSAETWARSAPAVHFTAEHLDRLGRILASIPVEIPRDSLSRWEGLDAATLRREARFLRAVDRAIAEMAGPRGRRRRK